MSIYCQWELYCHQMTWKYFVVVVKPPRRQCSYVINALNASLVQWTIDMLVLFWLIVHYCCCHLPICCIWASILVDVNNIDCIHSVPNIMSCFDIHEMRQCCGLSSLARVLITNFYYNVCPPSASFLCYRKRGFQKHDLLLWQKPNPNRLLFIGSNTWTLHAYTLNSHMYTLDHSPSQPPHTHTHIWVNELDYIRVIVFRSTTNNNNLCQIWWTIHFD